jgi:phosphoribosyl 1,2-cyclic phosphodiesterase
MKVTLWGTRGSLAAPGRETARYGGNTACVEVHGENGDILVLDAGTGIRRLGMMLPPSLRRVDILLTHLHMDHLQGLGFFAPLYNPAIEVHIWGPASSTLHLEQRLMRYLSPPLFPVRLRELPCQLFLHETPCGDFTIGDFHISSSLICHPGPTVGYRIETSQSVLSYLTDHEPALGVTQFPLAGEWTSGCSLAADADLLIHDAQYSSVEYAKCVGWGHSSLEQALTFATLVKAKHLVPFHHDPAHTDADLDRLIAETMATVQFPFTFTPGTEGSVFDLGSGDKQESGKRP